MEQKVKIATRSFNLGLYYLGGRQFKEKREGFKYSQLNEKMQALHFEQLMSLRIRIRVIREYSLQRTSQRWGEHRVLHPTGTVWQHRQLLLWEAGEKQRAREQSSDPISF
jgi:hypothetical protein